MLMAIGIKVVISDCENLMCLVTKHIQLGRHGVFFIFSCGHH